MPRDCTELGHFTLMNSPGNIQDPIFMNQSRRFAFDINPRLQDIDLNSKTAPSLIKARQDSKLTTAELWARAKQDGTLPSTPSPKYAKVYNLAQSPIVQPKPISPDEVLGSTTGLLTAASLAAPVLAPAAIAAGVGYGSYKLGQALHIW